ncbi:MAG: hypothetical protein ACRDJH_04535 [Thermomicrobiales bacterium]
MNIEELDRSMTHGGRHFAIRVYRDDMLQGTPCWHTVIIENKLPLPHGLGPSADMDGGVNAAVRFVTELVDAPAAGTVA